MAVSTTSSPRSDWLPTWDLAPISSPAKGFGGVSASAGVVNVAPTGNDDIDGLLFGTKWTGAVTFSFPDSKDDYPAIYGYNEPSIGFAMLTAAQRQAFFKAAAMVMGFTNLSLTYAGTGVADIQIAQSHAADPTAYAYYPWPSPEGGDIWIGREWDYTNPVFGDYNFMTMLHEFGHALGLKNSHETGGVANVPVPIEHDALEYTIESYRSYVGGPTSGGYTNEWYGFPTSFMMNDILALQTLYGADYTALKGNTVYSWDPATGQQFINGVGQLIPGGGSANPYANRVFMTVWDGGGKDTYDLSNYATRATIDLKPGGYSVTSNVQRAYLGDGHYAQGNVYNAYLFNGDARSYIENAIGGSGNDRITGNAADNVLEGRAGNDKMFGLGGSDTLIGGAGADQLDGGTGIDTLSYDGSAAGVTVDLATAAARRGDAQGDVIKNFENVTGGSGNDNLRGNASANVLRGGDGNDRLEGREGGDRLLGDDGVDTASYKLSTTGVTIFLEHPAANSGGAAGDRLVSIENIIGSAFADSLNGNFSNNRISAGSGHDMLFGRFGNDRLLGGGGNDSLSGGEGRDVLTGNAGRDVFVFGSLSDSGNSFDSSDVISDFAHLKDKIDVSAIDAISGGANDAFVFIGSLPFSAPGQIRAVQSSNDTILRFSTDGSSVDMTIRLEDVTAAQLTSADFVL